MVRSTGLVSGSYYEDEHIRMSLIALLILGLLVAPNFHAQGSDSDIYVCSQSQETRESLMKQAESAQSTVRRVEFVGTTYTRDEVLRRRMTELQEGDLFTRDNLVKSLKNMSRLRNEIYPVQLKDVEVKLNENSREIDLTICFKPKRR